MSKSVIVERDEKKQCHFTNTYEEQCNERKFYSCGHCDVHCDHDKYDINKGAETLVG